MPTYRIQTALQDRSGLPRDEYVNTLYVNFPAAATTAQLDSILGGVQTFYQSISGGLSPVIGASGHTAKAYLVGAPLQSPPVDEFDFSLSPAPSGSSLPLEVATCLSFHGSPQPGVVRQSWRGRIYLGPLNTGVLQTGGNTGSHVVDAWRTQCLTAAGVLAGKLNTAGKWVVYSKKLGRVFPVATYSMDDAFDTQRSRGNRPTNVMTETIPGGGGGSGSF